jgi:hypothetical protein
MADQFDRLMDRFGVVDDIWWYSDPGCWFRWREYDDGAWLVGNRCDPITYWGA